MEKNSWRGRLTRRIEQATEWLYPSLCLHCGEGASSGELLCAPCAEQVQLLSPEAAVITNSCDNLDNRLQSEGARARELLQRVGKTHIASCFDYEGAIVSLICRMKYGGAGWLAHTLSPFLVAQVLRLGWPQPDGVVFVPMASMKQWRRGYNQSELLAAEFAAALRCPLLKPLRRKNGEWPQSGSGAFIRKALLQEQFFLVDGEPLLGKQLLLVDDVYTTGATMHCCSELLLSMTDREVRGIVLARS